MTELVGAKAVVKGLETGGKYAAKKIIMEKVEGTDENDRYTRAYGKLFWLIGSLIVGILGIFIVSLIADDIYENSPNSNGIHSASLAGIVFTLLLFIGFLYDSSGDKTVSKLTIMKNFILFNLGAIFIIGGLFVYYRFGPGGESDSTDNRAKILYTVIFSVTLIFSIILMVLYFKMNVRNYADDRSDQMAAESAKDIEKQISVVDNDRAVKNSLYAKGPDIVEPERLNNFNSGEGISYVLYGDELEEAKENLEDALKSNDSEKIEEAKAETERTEVDPFFKSQREEDTGEDIMPESRQEIIEKQIDQISGVEQAEKALLNAKTEKRKEKAVRDLEEAVENRDKLLNSDDSLSKQLFEERALNSAKNISDPDAAAIRMIQSLGESLVDGSGEVHDEHLKKLIVQVEVLEKMTQELKSKEGAPKAIKDYINKLTKITDDKDFGEVVADSLERENFRKITKFLENCATQGKFDKNPGYFRQIFHSYFGIKKPFRALQALVESDRVNKKNCNKRLGQIINYTENLSTSKEIMEKQVFEKDKKKAEAFAATRESQLPTSTVTKPIRDPFGYKIGEEVTPVPVSGQEVLKGIKRRQVTL